MPRNKEHGLRKGMSPKMPMTVMCEWEACRQEFKDMVPFTSHVTKHLEDYLLSRDPPDSAEPEDFQCMWQDCLQEMGRDFIDLVRHVYFHAFHAKLKSFGQTIIEANELEDCSMEATSRNMIPELPDRLQCGWKDCDVIADNPDFFYQHVTSHMEIYGVGNCVEGGAPCLWEGCEAKTKNRYKLREHLRSHTQEKVIACPTCGGLFANTTKLFDHLQRQIQPTVQTYQCSHCNKRCPTERLLRDHMRHHVNHYKCPFCDMTCPNPSGLRAHIKYRHSEEKPYMCTECQYKGKTLADLRRHSVIHTTESTVFHCHVDGCMFEGKSYFALTIHFKKDHQGISSAQYQCHLCQQIFTRGTALTKHLKKGHKFNWPSGHKRFRYKLNDDGVYRLQTVRYESIELTQQLLSDKIGVSDTPSIQDPDPEVDEIENQEPMRTSTPEPYHDKLQDTSSPTPGTQETDLHYNLEMLGEVAMKLPKGRFCQTMESRKRKREDRDSDDENNSDLTDDIADFSDTYDESNCATSAHYSESECGRSEYEQSEFGGQSEYQQSEYPPSESCYMGSERYTESEVDPADSEASSARPTPRHFPIDPNPHFNFDNTYGEQHMELTETDPDLPPMYGPAASCVDMTGFSGSTLTPLQPTATDTHSPNKHNIHHLQPLPTSIEETTQMLLASQT